MAPNVKSKKRGRGRPPIAGTRASPFAEWIDKVGAAKLAKRLSVTLVTVRAWRRYAIGAPNGRRPRPELLGPILAAAAGRLLATDVLMAFADSEVK